MFSVSVQNSHKCLIYEKLGIVVGIFVCVGGRLYFVVVVGCLFVVCFEIVS